MRTFTTLTTLLALSGCTGVETGINRSTIVGSVVIEPVLLEEKSGPNDIPFLSQKLDPIDYAVTRIDGVVDGFELDGEGNETTDEEDVDWYQLESRFDLDEAGWTLTFPEVPAGTVLGVELHGPDEEGELDVIEEAELATEDEAGPLEVVLSSPIDSGTTYQIMVRGIQGEAEVAYELVLTGPHPDTANILVGAYRGNDPASRKPVGGGALSPFELDDDLRWVGTYQMLDIRGVRTADDGSTEVVNDIRYVWLFAGDWPRLHGALPAGTYYSSEPVRVRVPCNDVATADTLVLDDYAPVVIGIEHDEVEPNDMTIDTASFTMDTSDPSNAEDLGSVSGPGYVDIFRGNIDIGPGEGFIHDVDAFMFTTPAESLMFFNMDWDDSAADLDVVLYDADGNPLDWAATTNKPEVDGGYVVLEPEIIYYLAVAGYLGTEGSSPAYELRVEQLAP